MSTAIPNQQFLIAASGTTVGAMLYKTASATLPVPTISASATQVAAVFKSISRLQDFKEASTKEAMAMFYKLEPRYAELYRKLAND